MKLLLFKVLLQRRFKDEGFVLPIVFAIGLIMILLGVLNILSASEENLNAASDNQKNRAVAIAEVGVAKYRELLDKNRVLTVYNNTEWDGVTNTCDINSTITSFADEDEWHEVDNGSEAIGEYQLVSYIYDIDGDLTDNDDDGLFAPNDDNPNTTDLLTFNDDPDYNPRGVLTIKSRANDGSEAQVEVEIPIRINQEDMNNLYPALWLGSSNPTDLGNLSLGEDNNFNEDQDGNIVLSKPATGSTEGCDDPNDIAGGEVISDPRPLPSPFIPPTDATVINTLGDVSTNLNLNYDPAYYPGCILGVPPVPSVPPSRCEISISELILGRPENPPVKHKLWKTLVWQDVNGQTEQTWIEPNQPIPSGNKRIPHYFYRTTGDLTVDDQALVSDGSARVILYVDGDITLNNQAILDAGGSYASSMLLEIYGTERTQNITFQPNGQTINVTALIHAPDATVQVNGTGNVNIKGAVWVKDWDDNSGGNVQVRITPDSAGFGQRQAYDYYFGTDNRAAKPITNAPTDWEIQEVKDN
jgi:hypothetical protein